ncbi:MAG: YkgJ family cysteine cluster protein [Candidatus Hodarchaeota archaeon]
MNDTKQICKNCGKCCQKTEMLLSEQDIQLIEQIHFDLKRDGFTVLNKTGRRQLKNKDNSCFFFDNITKLCKIYKIRPQGCRFYPIIYDNDQGICIYDKDCPRVERFYLNEIQFKEICNNIKNFLKSELKIKL